ncbi:unnamed protein product, partial [Sphenostylis stenocarpa]
VIENSTVNVFAVWRPRRRHTVVNASRFFPLFEAFNFKLAAIEDRFSIIQKL